MGEDKKWSQTLPNPLPFVPDDCDEGESLDPNDSDQKRDLLRDHTTEHARPRRLEDEGQSGG
jgi:hypothetical protein